MGAEGHVCVRHEHIRLVRLHHIDWLNEYGISDLAYELISLSASRNCHIER